MEADMSLTQFAMDSQHELNRYKGDENLLVQFFNQPIPNDVKSATEGRPIFDDTEMIRIMIPGDKDNIVTRPVHDMDRKRFARAYQHWKSTGEEATDGTPLEQWPVVTRAQVEELKFFNVRTVEQLANVSDEHASKFMGINMLKNRARDFLDAASGTAIGTELRAQLEHKDAQIASMQETLEALTARVEALTSKEDDD